MTPILTTLAPGLLEAGSRLIDRLVPDPVEREKAKLALLQAEGQLALRIGHCAKALCGSP